MNKNASGPAIKAQFFCAHGQVEKITLGISKGSTQWEVISSIQDLTLESLINTWMQDYCSGVDPKQRLPLKISHLTPYTQKVLTALQKVPFGNSLTYQELAVCTQNPKAYRAAGTACARNPFPLVIPCHRVLGQTSLGGYAFGIPLKQALLRFEGIIS